MKKTIVLAIVSLLGLAFAGCGDSNPEPEFTYKTVNVAELEANKGPIYNFGHALTLQTCEEMPIWWTDCESGDTIRSTKPVCRDTFVVTLGPSKGLMNYVDADEGDELVLRKATSAAANTGASKSVSGSFLRWIRGPQAGDGLTNALLILLVLLVAALLFTIIHDWLRARSHPRQRTTESPDTDVTPVPHKVHCHRPCWYQTPPQEAKGIRLTHKTKDGDTFEVKIDGELPGPFVVTHEKDGKKETLSFGHLKGEEGSKKVEP